VALKPSEAKVFYDKFGKKQDSQELYERAALEELIAHAHLGEARSIFEFGCGTGRLAAKVLAEVLPASCTYVGCDLSTTMVHLAEERLAAYSPRARVLQSDGTIRFPVPDGSADRVISTYVLDLLSETDIAQYFREAHRVLVPGGLACLASLTRGNSPLSKTVSELWSLIFRARPSWVGGCRPVRLAEYADEDAWQIRYRNVLAAFGVPSEVLIARAKS
jgi:ubiquinone/menaquinone biosynthesis C-methylase UbiE